MKGISIGLLLGLLVFAPLIVIPEKLRRAIIDR
jgi:hypothetical protein